MMTFGKDIKKLRKEIGLYQAELAKRANTSQRMISELESEKYLKPGISLLSRIAKSLNCDLEINFKKKIDK